MATNASGRRVLVENDDLAHPDQLYAESAFAELYTDATGVQITMAGTAAIKQLGSDDADSGVLAASVAAVGVTTALTDGSFTVDKGGVYRLYFSGEVAGEEDEDVLIEWYKNGTALGEPAELNITFGIATTVEGALVQNISHECIVSLAAGDVLTLEFLGSNSEVITAARFNFGIEMLSSDTYEG